jgi:predicted DCC family thiol-disulfide oxidoreductase YuxK
MAATLPKTEPTSDKRKPPAAATVSDQPAALAPSSDVRLPSPAELPDADVVIYDGHCKFCTGQVKNLARWDGKGRLAFLSLHDEEVAKRYPDLTYEQMVEEMVVVDRQGRRHHGAAAFRYLTTRLPRLYILAPLMHIPFSMPLWHWGYKQVAKRRYLMGKTADACDDGACKVHFK